jgi:primosomal protein N' (replication factor Y)
MLPLAAGFATPPTLPESPPPCTLEPRDNAQTVRPAVPGDLLTAKREKNQRRQLWLLASEGQARQDLVAEVALRVRTSKLYSYGVPDSLADAVRPGALVRVPYGRAGRLQEGWCVRVTRRAWDHTYKPIEAVVAGEVPLSEALLELGLWVSEYYACPPGHTFDAIVPVVLRKPRLRQVRYVRVTGQSPGRPLSRGQQALLDAIGDGEVRRDEVQQAAGVGASALQTLRKRGLIEIITRPEAAGLPAPAPSGIAAAETGPQGSEEDAFTLTAGQRAALKTINKTTIEPSQFRVFLLFGVPGSGKTEVYVRAIRRVIAAGRQAIMLVPEIALATQVVERLARRFARVLVLHSRLKATTRERTLRAIAAGQVDVVIGTRTAVFAPCPRLGLIVADEEQESSFKNLQAPFFNARDVAIKRGQIERIPVVLGSATPALETWTNAKTLPHFQLLRLPERIPGARLPAVRLVETGRRELGQTSDLLSVELMRRLRETLSAGQQAILLHNRRGYAVYLRCSRCGLTVSCERCGSHMVYHRAENRIKCHRCGARGSVPEHCLDDSCGGRLQRVGLGIQRLEQELQRLFPKARLQRLDSDTMRRREDYAAALQRFAAHEADVLLGTQMVAKGLDFPGVRLVGVLEADAALWLPDFRAAESVFQLLVQVVGRAGRREGDSLALVQAENVALPAIRTAVEMDYEAFAEAELAIRHQLFDPPFSRLVRFICADARAGRARAEAAELAGRLRTLAGRVHAGIRVDDAEACVIPRLREMFRYQVLARVPRDADARRLLRAAEQEKALSPKVKRFTIDVDPLEML